eukprot:jgi/Chrzof1/2320/Cz11g10260.t1
MLQHTRRASGFGAKITPTDGLPRRQTCVLNHKRLRAPPRHRSALKATADDEQDTGFAGEDFYTILGVSPTADTKEIKRAYYGIVKECHPDLSGDDDDAAEFCMLVNDIYETLSDPDRRTLYDGLVGFAVDSINPFMDTSFPAEQVFVDEFTCIGCRNCTNVCPKTFDMEDDWGRARAMAQGKDQPDKLQEAIDTCPVNCIYWVTAPQLSLLEAAMAKMERVAVWALMSGGGGGKDVFTEASLAWEKRQADVRAKLQQQQDQSTWSGFWSMSGFGASAGSNMYDKASKAGSSTQSDTSSQSGGNYTGNVGGREGARIANLAAKAARASRQWKSLQELQQRGKQLQLTAVSSVNRD